METGSRTLAMAPASTTSSIPGNRTCRTSWSRVCERLAFRSRQSVRALFLRNGRADRRALRRTGIEISEEDKQRPYVEVSGRKGLGVKADDLIDKLIEKALEEVDSRHPDDSADERPQVATQIAIGALRYFMLKFTRNSVIAFDFGEALSFEGETGPYVQYAAVRARNILRKSESAASPAGLRNCTNAGKHGSPALVRGFLAIAARGFEGRQRRSSAPSPQANRHMLHDTRFSSRRRSTLSITTIPFWTSRTRRRRVFLLWMTDYFRSQLEGTLNVLGIDVPEYM